MRFRESIIAALTSACLSLTAACDPLSAVQASHILANAPDQEDFNRLLQRDLDAYFSDAGIPNARTEFDLLRRGATQSGVAYPKYYLWVRVRRGEVLESEGAARVAAVDGTHFMVTHFLTQAEIAEDPGQVGTIFPAALVPAIADRASEAQKRQTRRGG